MQNWVVALVLFLCFAGMFFFDWYSVYAGEAKVWGVNGLQALQTLVSGEPPAPLSPAKPGSMEHKVIQTTMEAMMLVLAAGILGLTTFTLYAAGKKHAPALHSMTLLLAATPAYYLAQIAHRIGTDYIYLDAPTGKIGLGTAYAAALLAAFCSATLSVTAREPRRPKQKWYTAIDYRSLR